MNYVATMLARPKTIRTCQMSSVQNVDIAMEIYLKNAFVCLSSVSINNPDVETLLFVDFELGEKWQKCFESNGIRVINNPFGEFSINEEFHWDIAQYKYDTMKAMCALMQENDTVAILDTDVVCVGSLDNIFEEAKYRLCLYDVQHSLDARDRKSIVNDYLKIYTDQTYGIPIHYGGEFIGANKRDLERFLKEVAEVVRLGNSTEGLVNFNDEHITSIAADNLKKRGVLINNANAYIYRYWTGHSFRGEKFYLTSTNYCYNPVVLWHLPDEKRLGVLRVYDYLIRHGRLPRTEQMARWFGFPKTSRTHKIRYVLTRIVDKLKKK